MHATYPQLRGGNAAANSRGPAQVAASATGQATAAAVLGAAGAVRSHRAFIAVQPLRRAVGICLAASLLALAPSACGRGPVEPPPITTVVPTIQFLLYVAGQITANQGNYIIAINADVTPTTNVNAAFGETPGEPTAQEAQGSPATYTHWDQELIYGNSTLGQPNGFLYKYKVLSGSTGSATATFLPIILTSNQFQLITNGSVGTGSGNVLAITIPLSELSVRGNPTSPNPPTITMPAVTQIYVNYITTDTNGVPQDQLGANGLGTVGFSQTVDLTQSNTVTLPNFAGAPGPPNPNLFITGGQIIVTL